MRKSVERPHRFAPRKLCVAVLGLAEETGAILQRDDGIHLGIERLDAIEMRVHHLHARHLAGAIRPRSVTASSPAIPPSGGLSAANAGTAAPAQRECRERQQRARSIRGFGLGVSSMCWKSIALGGSKDRNYVRGAV
jgi:hypothetical protein